MDSDSLTAYVNRIQSLNEQRNQTTRAAFEWLSRTDKELHELATKVLGDKRQAALWLVDNINGFDGKMPLELLLQNRRQEVVECLYRIQYGMWV